MYAANIRHPSEIISLCLPKMTKTEPQSCSNINVSIISPINSWFNLRIKQYYDGSEYLWKTFIDGQLAHVKANNNPTTFNKVDGILGYKYNPGRLSN